MPTVRYEIQGIAHCRTQAMVHFKQFLELMEDGSTNMGDESFVVLIDFCSNDGSQDAALRDAYSCPDGIIPLFVSVDKEPSAGFSMLHGVSKHGAPWDSEGQA